MKLEVLVKAMVWKIVPAAPLGCPASALSCDGWQAADSTLVVGEEVVVANALEVPLEIVEVDRITVALFEGPPVQAPTKPTTEASITGRQKT